MQSKIYLLLVILSVFVICSISVDQKQRKNDSLLDSKKKVGAYDKDENRYKDKQENYDDDEMDDYHPSLSSYGDNPYSGFSPAEGNYRTRARWPSSSSSSLFLSPPPSSYDDFMNGNDLSRFEFPNTVPAPLPSISYDNNPMFSSGPSCNSLVDPQYPIFTDTCGAVPQARYSLPNSFGHRERWQVAQILNTLVSSSADPACTRSLRLLLCPVLFPPCPTRHEPPPVLPCQSYCRAVKARCAIPTLDLLPCEVLPYSSDLCPTNQAYGSFIPPGAYPPVNQPLPMTGGLPSSNYQMPRSFPSLQAFLSSQGLQSTLTPSSLPSAQSTGPSNVYNSGPYPTDSSNSMLVDFPSRSYTNDYRQASRYAPLTRSSTETRPTTESRFPTAPRSSAVPSAGSSVVKA
jgi:hypothetical protein